MLAVRKRWQEVTGSRANGEHLTSREDSSPRCLVPTRRPTPSLSGMAPHMRGCAAGFKELSSPSCGVIDFMHACSRDSVKD